MLFDFSGILPAEAELMYVNEVERLDGFGQEVFPVKVVCPGLSLLRPSGRDKGTGKAGVDSRGQNGVACVLPRVAFLGRSSLL